MPGIWVPAVTLFDPDTDELLPADQSRYYKYLASTGLTGLVVLGTNAETFLLTREERQQLVRLAREAVGPDFPLLVGISGHSTRQVLEFADDAAAAGADYGLLLPPAYFGKATTPQVIEGFFDEVAARSPLPIVIYNFPGVCNGIDLDSDTIARLVTRLAAVLPTEKFATFGGQSDFLLGGLAVGSAGCICAFGNVFPRVVVEIYRLWKQGKTQEALALQQKQSLAEQPCKGGIASVKYAAAIYTAPKAGIEDGERKMRPRRPYVEAGAAAKEACRSGMAQVAGIEESLA
ncbi:hypothetical protein PG994_008546 [Apiospora phragmitis]|uniref:Dihydrodipicolinate synthase family protein n=1 Tax=Apiospora phragmitis TaxID=2905665 RepID=A0ABR1UJN6_9PEZI